MQLRTHEINLWVSDLERAAGFYREAFGFKQVESDDAFRKLSHGDITITLFQALKKEAYAPETGMMSMMTCDLVTDEFDACLKGIKLAGGSYSEVGNFEGKRHTLFRDLDGINWELIEA